MTDLDDVSAYSFYERAEHYKKQMGMYDLPMHERPKIADMAHQQVTAEMLDEIHTMLRHLIK